MEKGERVGVGGCVWWGSPLPLPPRCDCVASRAATAGAVRTVRGFTAVVGLSLTSVATRAVCGETVRLRACGAERTFTSPAVPRWVVAEPKRAGCPADCTVARAGPTETPHGASATHHGGPSPRHARYAVCVAGCPTGDATKIGHEPRSPP